MNPIMKMFGIKKLRKQDGNEYFHNVFPHIKSTSVCAEFQEKISQLRVKEALPEEEDSNPYYAWKYPKGDISLIYPSKIQVEVCFPYGIEIARRNGGGNLIKVVITEVLDKVNFCDEFSETEKEIILAFFYELESRGMSPQSLMESFRTSFGKYPEIGISTKIDSSRLLITQRNEKENLYYITIDDEVEFYHIDFEDRQWFFKEYKTYKYIKLIIYGKDNVVITQ